MIGSFTKKICKYFFKNTLKITILYITPRLYDSLRTGHRPVPHPGAKRLDTRRRLAPVSQVHLGDVIEVQGHRWPARLSRLVPVIQQVSPVPADPALLLLVEPLFCPLFEDFGHDGCGDIVREVG